MTIADLMENLQLEGAVRVQKWNEETADNEILYETEDIRYDYNIPYRICVKGISYMYSVITELGATIIIDIGDED